MVEQFNFVKDYHDVTTVHPVGLAALAAAVLAVFLAPRRGVLLPVLLIASMIAPAQRIVLVDLDFTFLRLVILAAWARVLMYGEARDLRINLLDRLMVAWVGFGAAAYLLLYPNPASIGYKLGFGLDALGTYFLVRVVVRDLDALTSLSRQIALLSIPVALAMVHERLTGYNAFSMFGGVPEQTLERYGRFRAQGAQPHPIIAGSFWAVLIPVVAAGVRRTAESITVTVAGLLSCATIVWCSSSSTPVIVTLVAVAAMLLFPVRWAVPWMRGSTIVGLVVLHFLMVGPVWHLFARINVFPGSTGWWRYLIIDLFVTNWSDWFLFGTRESAGWLTWISFTDVTNQYVNEGINGGIVRLLLFVAILVFAFVLVGRSVRSAERSPTGATPAARAARVRRAWVAWCIGASMACHAAAYFATSYFGHMRNVQYLSFALAGSVIAVAGQATVRVRRREEEPAEAAAAGAVALVADATDEGRSVREPDAAGVPADPARPRTPRPWSLPIGPGRDAADVRPGPSGRPLFRPV